MTTEKRIELAAMFLARCINEQLDIRASSDTRKKLCMYALAWADALSEVAEGDKPKTRYDWSKAPEWARWAATDEDGNAYFYSKKPHININSWIHGTTHGRITSATVIVGDSLFWVNSLEARPNA